MSIDNSWFDTAFGPTPLMAILRGLGRSRAIETAHAAWGLGVHLIEIPIQTPEDIETLAALVDLARPRGLAVGAGTVTTREHVDQARRAGARFVVSPGWDQDINAYAAEQGIHPLPGVGSATDVQAATAQGLTWLKAFPAAALGSNWINLMKGPFPRIHFIATGGISAANADEFLRAGAQAVAVGSSLNDPEQLPLLAQIRI
ncbi:2-keto-3-deoxy-phosphogluconate aldolase [Rhodococcus wratislaviensis]|uniref:2-dehydro-3-deoxyphosphooctonate aldolase n=1 Tax=Rhodococcus wratislaviensis TaxID=44752 RepID=A0AB38FDI4_RHOWR|nr:bifunctional 4-hydroxy-2-oxoglutarate aldolase/2-dehydro-3-deoxy-phosphogluconate aldolase [Rhodococcus wratislaviensis]REE75453.1 2-keto-3-deoxy-phosphogluconate aldolase [Rhodococcus wratislaviensis]SPZ39513.1 2-dehydro-3-deoxyphosphooctonate aldolase [Rhodococcus wratislaviensis]